ncbi:hypothetical protein [Bacillus velezensis]|uniref:hypothetical protein n=1 Tax=Bacillus velezensis TaxID=492670 RepID=UPI001A92095E|nr:hypothetical protein [Bacillus velezensis]BCT30362.1 hypothetical protein BVAD3_40360 [Bacillus velezensis]
MERYYIQNPGFRINNSFQQMYLNEYAPRDNYEDNILSYMERERQGNRRRTYSDIIGIIDEKRRQFIQTYGLDPNTVFISSEDYQVFQAQTSWRLDSVENLEIMGMKLELSAIEQTTVGVLV